ncbi:hypothetical protein [Tardiphaga sp. 862_B3_N1_1]|uniref:hypothetical protein n=1 Tax=Tardiphaga sp. 862_B3_N1_1 TaxID=3240763 RepID=UPI003F8B5B8C
MAITAAVKKLLNNLTPGARTAKLGDLMDKATAQGVAVPDAAGAAPTAAEFKALLDSLRDAGKIAKS